MASSDRSRMRSRGGTSVRRKSNSSYSFVITCCGEMGKIPLGTPGKGSLSAWTQAQREGRLKPQLCCFVCTAREELKAPGNWDTAPRNAALGAERDMTCPVLGLQESDGIYRN